MTGPCTPYLGFEALKADPRVCLPDPPPAGYDEVLALFCQRASEVVYALTGNQFPGECTTTRWPMRRVDACCSPRLPFEAMILGGGCCTDDGIDLWGMPREITAKIDGVPFTDFILMDGHKLLRTDGKAWPTSNNWRLPDSEEGTFTLTWKFGPPTPLIVASGALELAVQYQLESVQDPRSVLPPDVTSFSQQGTNYTIDREVERVRQAGPSLQALMVAMAAYNPGNARRPADVWSPDHAWELVSVENPAS